MHRLRLTAGLALLALLALNPAFAQEKKVSLDVVKYAGLKDAVLKHRGQVVLVDFWGFF